MNHRSVTVSGKFSMPMQDSKQHTETSQHAGEDSPHIAGREAISIVQWFARDSFELGWP